MLNNKLAIIQNEKNPVYEILYKKNKYYILLFYILADKSISQRNGEPRSTNFPNSRNAKKCFT